MASIGRTGEIFLTCCLEGEVAVVSRILKRNRKSWTGIIGSNGNFNINSVDSSRRTGLMLACLSNSVDIVDLLLSRMDLDVNLADMFGATALMYASKQEPGEEVVRLLLERKDLDLDGKDGDGKTAEDYAAALTNNAVVQLIREERSRRMGGVWTHLNTSGEESEEEEDGEDEKEEEDEKGGTDDTNRLERENHTKDNSSSNDESNEDDFLQSQFMNNLRERLSQELSLKEGREEKYLADLSKLRAEKEASETVLKLKLQQLENNFLASKKLLDDSYNKDNQKSQSMIDKLEKAMTNIDLKKILNASTSCSELECPICLEEMRPPTRIWQCPSGHPVCDSCIRNPRVSQCPTCRQGIVGRNVLAEKLARSLFN